MKHFHIYQRLSLFAIALIFIGAGCLQNNAKTENDGQQQADVAVTSFQECVDAGFPIMESYPRQCRDGEGNLFVEDIGSELEKQDLIRLEAPRPGESITSPLTIQGEARGTWFHEATFPVVLTDWDGKIIAEGYATAQDDWMTEEFVPFTATVTFDSPVFEDVDEDHFSHRGALILQKANPSGLPENDDALEIPVRYTAAGKG